MKRNPHNTNQKIHQGSEFHNFKVQEDHGPLIANHLNKTLNCFDRALQHYTRVCMMRFDLHVPDNYAMSALTDNSLIARFFASLKSKIACSQAHSMRAGNRVNQTDLRYIWCRESSTFGRTHFHVAILVNQDAYAFIGKFDLTSNNMFTRIHEAWASALGIYVDDALGLVNIPSNPVYLLHRDDEQSIQEAFYRVSYLSKLDTKQFDAGIHSFGSSRI